MGKINRVHISCSPLVQHVHNNGTISHILILLTILWLTFNFS